MTTTAQRRGVILKSPEEIAVMREAGRIVAEVMQEVLAEVKPGATGRDLDRVVRRAYKTRSVTPTFLGYHGYPATLCVSINDEIVHGIPNDRPFREGDIVSIDMGVTYKGFVGDHAISVGVGKMAAVPAKLIQVTREALERGIEQARPGNRMGDIGHAVQTHAEVNGFAVVREYVGHGVGRAMHEDPQVPNYGEPGKGLILKPGMVIAIEPMLNTGGWQTKRHDDGWLVSTEDGSLSAHFEHTLAITADGPTVLTVA
jgi:methionyl aminopeptidase